MTNLEKIKNMSLEEFAEYIYRLADCRECPIYCSDGNCTTSWERWLQSEGEVK